MDQILENLGSPNVTGAVVGFILTSVLAFVLWLIRRRRWEQINVELVSQSPQISISQDLAEDITIRYKGEPTSQVVLTQLRVYNQGDDTIDDVVFFIEADLVTGPREKYWLTPPKVVDLVGKTTYEKGESSRKDSSEFERKSVFSYKFSRPFLNPIRKDKDEELRISFFSSHEISLRVSGSGPGWSVELSDATAQKLPSRIEYWIFAITLIGTLLSIALGDQYSFLVVVFGIPFLIVMFRFLLRSPQFLSGVQE